MLKDLDTNTYEEQLKDLGMFSLQKRQLKGDRITVSGYLRRCLIEGGLALISAVSKGKTRIIW